MNVWTCNDFEGYWPVGTSAVVVASTEAEARSMLAADLKARNLPGDDFSLVVLDTNVSGVRVLQNGDY